MSLTTVLLVATMIVGVIALFVYIVRQAVGFVDSAEEYLGFYEGVLADINTMVIDAIEHAGCYDQENLDRLCELLEDIKMMSRPRA